MFDLTYHTGIASHARNYSCLWSKGGSLLDAGEKRTYSSLNYN